MPTILPRPLRPILAEQDGTAEEYMSVASLPSEWAVFEPRLRDQEPGGVPTLLLRPRDSQMRLMCHAVARFYGLTSRSEDCVASAAAADGAHKGMTAKTRLTAIGRPADLGSIDNGFSVTAALELHVNRRLSIDD